MVVEFLRNGWNSMLRRTFLATAAGLLGWVGFVKSKAQEPKQSRWPKQRAPKVEDGVKILSGCYQGGRLQCTNYFPKELGGWQLVGYWAWTDKTGWTEWEAKYLPPLSSWLNMKKSLEFSGAFDKVL